MVSTLPVPPALTSALMDDRSGAEVQQCLSDDGLAAGGLLDCFRSSRKGGYETSPLMENQRQSLWQKFRSTFCGCLGSQKGKTSGPWEEQPATPLRKRSPSCFSRCFQKLRGKGGDASRPSEEQFPSSSRRNSRSSFSGLFEFPRGRDRDSSRSRESTKVGGAHALPPKDERLTNVETGDVKHGSSGSKAFLLHSKIPLSSFSYEKLTLDDARWVDSRDPSKSVDAVELPDLRNMIEKHAGVNSTAEDKDALYAYFLGSLMMLDGKLYIDAEKADEMARQMADGVAKKLVNGVIVNRGIPLVTRDQNSALIWMRTCQYEEHLRTHQPQVFLQAHD